MAHRVSYLAAEIGGYHAARTYAATPYTPELLDVLLHNWADAISIETAYSTDVTPAITLTEELCNLNPRPLRQITARIDAIRQADCARVLALLTRIGNQPTPFPIYCDWSPVTANSSNGSDTAPFGQTSIIPCDTSDRRLFVGAQVIVFDLNSVGRPTNIEVQTIVLIESAQLTVTRLKTSRTARARVVPVIYGQITLESDATILTDEAISANLRVTESTGPTQLPGWSGFGDSPDTSTYQQIPILELRHNWNNGPTIKVRRAGALQQEGRAPFIETFGIRSRLTFSFSAAGIRRADAVHALRFIDSRNGRLRSFWMLNPLSVFSVVSLTTTYVEIERLLTVDDVWRTLEYVGFKYLDGSTEARQLWRVEDTGVSLKLYFSNNMPSLRIDLNTIRQITSAHLVRLTDDSYTELWDTDGSVAFEFEAIEMHDMREVPRVVFSDSFGFSPLLIKDLFGYWIPDPTRMFKPDTTAVGVLDDPIDRWLDSVYNRALRTPLAPYHTWYPAQLSVRAAAGGTTFELETNEIPHSNALGFTVFIAAKNPVGFVSGPNEYLLRFPNSTDSARDSLQWTFTELYLNEGLEYLEQATVIPHPDLSYPRGSPHIFAFVWIPGGTVRVYRDGILLNVQTIGPHDLPAALPFAMRLMNWSNVPADPTSVDDAQLYRVLMYSRALNKRELNGAAGALQQVVAGSTWRRVV